MPDSEISGVDHVQITVPAGREIEARAFYLTFLGLTEVPKPESLGGRGGFWMLAGQLPVHVGTEPEWDRSQTRAHVAFAVLDVDAWRMRFREAGYPAIESISIPGRDRFESLDPFGNRIEIIGPARPQSAQ
jgi:catechol 2,3-dioxygenase-like lactoylglutathione lyase family enzyme